MEIKYNNTGIYIRVKRNGKMENVLLENLTKSELQEAIVIRAEEPIDWIYPMVQILNNYQLKEKTNYPSVIELIDSGYDKEFFFGSCQYSQIKWFLYKFNETPEEFKEEFSKFNEILFPLNTLDEDKRNEFLTNLIDTIKKDFLIEVDNEDSMIKASSISEVYTYCKNNSWDLWGANAKIMNYFLRLTSSKNDYEDFSNNFNIALSIKWLLENKLVPDMECFCNFDT